MGFSAISKQQQDFLAAIDSYTELRPVWKYLVLDDHTRRQLNLVAEENTILERRIVSLNKLDESRQQDTARPAIYLVRPRLDVVAIIAADVARQMYQSTSIIWTSKPSPEVQYQISSNHHLGRLPSRVYNLDYFSQESHLVTLRNPWSFPLLFHPQHQKAQPEHASELARKVADYCISINEYPIIRFYRPLNPKYYASERAQQLATAVKSLLEGYRQIDPNFPAPSATGRSTLFILDRALDLVSPLIHDFRYQAMAFDLLEFDDSENITFRLYEKPGEPPTKRKIVETDDLWTNKRHQKVDKTMDELVAEFAKFTATDPNALALLNKQEKIETTDVYSLAKATRQIERMMAGQPEFLEKKRNFEVHINLANSCADLFNTNSLKDVGVLEQSMVLGIDENYAPARDIRTQVIKLLAQDSVLPSDRIRLLCLYSICRGGFLRSDAELLLRHAGLPASDANILHAFELIGGPGERKPGLPFGRAEVLFPVTKQMAEEAEEWFLYRWTPDLYNVLSRHVTNALREDVFPYASQEDRDDFYAMSENLRSQQSLRTNRPTWMIKPTQDQVKVAKPKILVFMAGGATYSEARSCYQVGQNTGKDVILLTTHMLTPRVFLNQVGDLNRRITLPVVPRNPPIPVMKPQNPPQSAPPGPAGPDQPVRVNNQPAPSVSSSSSSPAPPPPPWKSAPQSPMPPSGQDGRESSADKKSKSFGLGRMLGHKKHKPPKN